MLCSCKYCGCDVTSLGEWERKTARHWRWMHCDFSKRRECNSDDIASLIFRNTSVITTNLAVPGHVCRSAPQLFPSRGPNNLSHFKVGILSYTSSRDHNRTHEILRCHKTEVKTFGFFQFSCSQRCYGYLGVWAQSVWQSHSRWKGECTKHINCPVRSRMQTNRVARVSNDFSQDLKRKFAYENFLGFSFLIGFI